MGATWNPRLDHQKAPEIKRFKKTLEFDRLLNSVRERVEGAFDLLKEGGRSVEHTLALTVEGLCMRVIAKVTSGTFRLFLRRFLGIDVLTYTINQWDFTSDVRYKNAMRVDG